MAKLVTVSFFKQDQKIFSKQSYSLCYMLQGDAKLTMDERAYGMKCGDVIVINPSQLSHIHTRAGLFAKFTIDARQVSKLIDDQMVYLECNTVKEQHEGFVKLRYLLDHLVNSLLEEKYQQLFFQQYAYELVAFLIAEFSHNIVFDTQGHQRITEIKNYIELHYQEELTLEEISKEFALTPPYFSKYFKEQTQISYLKYLNQVRLEQACEDIVSSNMTLLRIALEHGFPNLASFSRVFYQTYQITPGQYRMQQKKREESLNIALEEVKEQLHQSEEIKKSFVHQIDIDFNQAQSALRPYWFELCNLGSLSAILHDGMKDAINQLQEELGFRYARIVLDQTNFENTPDFYIEEHVLDFLFEHKFIMYFVIDFRQYETQAGFQAYMKAFLSHFINRYGFSNVEAWKYELFYDSDFKGDKAKRYHTYYQILQQILQEAGLSAKICGPGLLLDEEGQNLIQFIKENAAMKHVTISVAPYSIRNRQHSVFIHRTTDTGYIFDQYQLAQSICQAMATDIQLSIISWKDELNDSSIMNDACYRGARILQNMIKGYQLLPSLPIDKILDLQMEQYKNNQMFSGLSGLISRKGIKKPSFYAYTFLKKLDHNVIMHDSHVLVTCSSKRYIQLVCHNCKKLNYKYYIQEDTIGNGKELSQYYEDVEVCKLSFRFSNMENGSYVLKQRRMNEVQGSAYKRWLDMEFGKDSFYGVDEVDYLKAVAKPTISGSVLEVSDGILEFECLLEANEIQHLHLIYQH